MTDTNPDSLSADNSFPAVFTLLSSEPKKNIIRWTIIISLENVVQTVPFCFSHLLLPLLAQVCHQVSSLWQSQPAFLNCGLVSCRSAGPRERSHNLKLHEKLKQTEIWGLNELLKWITSNSIKQICLCTYKTVVSPCSPKTPDSGYQQQSQCFQQTPSVQWKMLAESISVAPGPPLLLQGLPSPTYIYLFI